MTNKERRRDELQKMFRQLEETMKTKRPEEVRRVLSYVFIPNKGMDKK